MLNIEDSLTAISSQHNHNFSLPGAHDCKRWHFVLQTKYWQTMVNWRKSKDKYLNIAECKVWNLFVLYISVHINKYYKNNSVELCWGIGLVLLQFHDGTIVFGMFRLYGIAHIDTRFRYLNFGTLNNNVL